MIGRKWTKEKCIDALKAFYRNHNRIPKQKELNSRYNLPGSSTITRWCGTLNNAVIMAGYLPRDITTMRFQPFEYTEEEIIRTLVNYRKEYGKFPDPRITEDGMPSEGTIRRRFGTSLRARELAMKYIAYLEIKDEIEKTFKELMLKIPAKILRE